MHNDKINKELIIKQEPSENSEVDEDMSLFIYGNLKIKDLDTGEVLVDQRF